MRGVQSVPKAAAPLRANVRGQSSSRILSFNAICAPLLACGAVRSGIGTAVFQLIKKTRLEKQLSRKLKLSRRVSGADSTEG